MSNPLLYEWYESWCSDLLYDDTIIEDMDTLLIHTRTYRRLGREDSYMLISFWHNCFRSWYRHPEDMPPGVYLLLEPSERMDARSITGKDDDIDSLLEQIAHASLRECTYLISCFITVWGIFRVHKKYHLYIGKYFLEFSHDYLSTETRVEKSDFHNLYYKWKFYKTKSIFLGTTEYHKNSRLIHFGDIYIFYTSRSVNFLYTIVSRYERIIRSYLISYRYLGFEIYNPIIILLGYQACASPACRWKMMTSWYGRIRYDIHKKSGNYFPDCIDSLYFVYFFRPTNADGLCPIRVRPTAMMRIRETHIAVKSESTIPRPSMSPNPFMSDIPNT